MNPLVYLWIHLVAVMLPRSARAAWRGSWLEEASHRRLSLRLLDNIARDAAFTRQRAISDNTLPVLLWESSAFVLASLLWFTLAFPAPPPCGTNLQRVAVVQRSCATMGLALSTVTARLRDALQQAPPFEALAAFRIQPAGSDISAAVSRNFFHLLGIRPPLGTVFTPRSPLDEVVLTHSFWRRQFRADPNILQRTAVLNGRTSRIIGVLPADFTFASPRIAYFTLMSDESRPSGALVLLRPGFSLDVGQQVLRQIGPQQEEGWRSTAFRLIPYLTSTSWRDVFPPAAAVALACFAASVLILIWHRSIGAFFFAILFLRLLLSMTALAEISSLLARLATALLLPAAVLHLWLFTMAALIITLFTLRDHQNRCPQCLTPLRLPARLGTYSSLMLDAPATEYACPRGHGLRFQNETGDRRSRWTRLHPSWRSLFHR